MSQGPPPNKRLRYLIHLNSRHDACKYPLLFQRVLQCERIDDGGQHAHMVGGDAIHVLRLLGHAAKKISSAHHNGSLNPEFLDVAELGGDLVNARRVHTKALVRRQSFTGYFEQNAFEDRSWIHS